MIKSMILWSRSWSAHTASKALKEVSCGITWQRSTKNILRIISRALCAPRPIRQSQICPGMSVTNTRIKSDYPSSDSDQMFNEIDHEFFQTWELAEERLGQRSTVCSHLQVQQSFVYLVNAFLLCATDAARSKKFCCVLPFLQLLFHNIFFEYLSNFLPSQTNAGPKAEGCLHGGRRECVQMELKKNLRSSQTFTT